jgi:uncharacterized protein
MKPKILIVDGHSMIFQWPQFRDLHSRNTMAARERLVQILRDLQDSSEWQVAVVFDGKGTKASEHTEPGGIQVFYSKAGQTADSVIERLTAKYAATCDITVATDDTMERQTVATFGGSSMSSFQLYQEIESARTNLGEHLKKLKGKANRRR